MRHPLSSTGYTTDAFYAGRVLVQPSNVTETWHRSANQTKWKQKEAPRSGHWERDLPAVEENSIIRKEKKRNTEGLGTEEKPDSALETAAYVGSRVLHGQQIWKRKESDTYQHWNRKKTFTDEGRLLLRRSAECHMTRSRKKNSVPPMHTEYGIKNDPEKSSALMYDNGQRNISEGKENKNEKENRFSTVESSNWKETQDYT